MPAAPSTSATHAVTDHTAAAWARFSDGLWRWFRARVNDDATADDLLQTLFLRIHEKHGSLQDADRIAGWVWRIARHVVADHYRAQRNHASVDDVPEAADPAAVEPVPDELGALAIWLGWTVDELPEPYRDAVRLTELEGKTMREAADELGISVSGAKSRVQRGRQMLKKRLLRCCSVDVDHRGAPVDFHRKGGPNPGPLDGSCGC